MMMMMMVMMMMMMMMMITTTTGVFHDDTYLDSLVYLVSYCLPISAMYGQHVTIAYYNVVMLINHSRYTIFQYTTLYYSYCALVAGIRSYF